ncbi:MULTISPECIES: hypothetical protein [Klebsiella]|nr:MULTISPECIES: hypothetical protein [Klebsiella]EKJ7337490.1 hypothetical protein [Klebsiella pneumoniae]EKX6495257.1 hypothetical protein [Klebsiella pneumoniae]EKX6677672.1 hypothetical protein [Klebsiella pneumoniae]EKY1369992.1 hypothetical protein [Klebsiella pneumoniae]ELA0958370.1 hypothetical protein [Klebsiella pneumoniae]
MDTFEKGSDLLSKRIIAVTGLILALGSIGLSPIAVVPICLVMVFLLRK